MARWQPQSQTRYSINSCLIFSDQDKTKHYNEKKKRKAVVEVVVIDDELNVVVETKTDLWGCVDLLYKYIPLGYNVMFRNSTNH